MTELSGMRTRLEREKGKLSQVDADIKTTLGTSARLEALLSKVSEAQAIIQAVAEATQEQVGVEISGLVTMALEAIFPEPYEFVCRFVRRRGKTEADLLFRKGGVDHSPMLSSGGGVVDVAAFALRVALWSLSKSSRPVIVLDEPMKHLSADLRPRAAELVRALADELGLQVIMVTHAEEFVEAADRAFWVSIRGGESEIRREDS